MGDIERSPLHLVQRGTTHPVPRSTCWGDPHDSSPARSPSIRRPARNVYGQSQARHGQSSLTPPLSNTSQFATFPLTAARHTTNAVYPTPIPTDNQIPDPSNRRRRNRNPTNRLNGVLRQPHNRSETLPRPPAARSYNVSHTPPRRGTIS